LRTRRWPRDTRGKRQIGREKKDRDRHAHSRDYVTRYKKQVTHTYTQQEKRARERDAKGHPPGATPESVLSFYYTLLRLPSLLSSTIFLSANVTTLRKRRSPESERGRDEGEIPPPPSSFGERLPTPGDLARRKRNRSAAILVRDSRHLPCQLYQLVVVVVQHGCEVPFLFPFLSHARVVLSHPFQCPSILSLPALSSSTVIIPSESPIPSSRTAQDSRRLSLTRTRQSPLARVRHLKEFRYTPIVPRSRHSRERHSGSFPLTVRSFSPVLVPRYVPPRDEKRRQWRGIWRGKRDVSSGEEATRGAHLASSRPGYRCDRARTRAADVSGGVLLSRPSHFSRSRPKAQAPLRDAPKVARLSWTLARVVGDGDGDGDDVGETGTAVPKDGDATPLPLARSFVRGVFRTSAKVTRCRSGRRESYCAPRVSCCFLLSPRDVASYGSCAESAGAVIARRYPELTRDRADPLSLCPPQIVLTVISPPRCSRNVTWRTRAYRSGTLLLLSDKRPFRRFFRRNVILKSHFTSILLMHASHSLIYVNCWSVIKVCAAVLKRLKKYTNTYT